jgi:hypothetical protein
MQDATVYDLGNIDHHTAPRAVSAAGSSAASASGRYVARREPATVSGRLLGTLSLFVPGSGQIVAGQTAVGGFLLTSIGFLAAVCWAVANTFERLASTLPWFGLPTQAPFWILPAAFLIAAALHVTAVLHAESLGEPADRTLRPLWAGLASLLIPGWGQLLNGARARAALFLSGVWLLGGATLLITPPVQRLLAAVGLALPLDGLPAWVGPVAIAVPVVIWTLAVYDAAAWAAARDDR